MIRIPIWTLTLSLTLASAAAAAPTAQQKCEGAKVTALAKRVACRAGEHKNEILGTKVPNLAKCVEAFEKAIAAADKNAAKTAASCRWLDNADGTVIDLNTGLQWELKSYDVNGSPYQNVHDVNLGWTWGVPYSPYDPVVFPGGNASVVVLGTLNAGISFDGVAPRNCFADKCDWRLPTVEELRTILASEYPNCTPMAPPYSCTTIPGSTNTNPMSAGYWTSTTDDHDATKAWVVSFRNGFVSSQPKASSGFVRAVRGEM